MLFEDNKPYIFIRFLVILFGTTGMTFGIVRFEKNFKIKILILCAFMPYAIIVTLIPILFFRLGFAAANIFLNHNPSGDGHHVFSLG